MTGGAGATARSAWRRCTVPWPSRPAVADAVAQRPGVPLLLVDDRVDTGWTLTEASRLLREAGAGAVLPLVLAVDA